MSIETIRTDDHETHERTASAILGDAGERLAAEFLRSGGYRIVLTNFKAPVGRNSRGAQITGEIDVIALNGETLCFIEVKTRTSDEFAPPSAAVNRRKQRQIIRTAQIYRRIFGLTDMLFRYDIVSIVIGDDTEPRIELLKGFWSESDFAKRRWSTYQMDHN